MQSSNKQSKTSNINFKQLPDELDAQAAVLQKKYNEISPNDQATCDRYIALAGEIVEKARLFYDKLNSLAVPTDKEKLRKRQVKIMTAYFYAGAQVVTQYYAIAKYLQLIDLEETPKKNITSMRAELSESLKKFKLDDMEEKISKAIQELQKSIKTYPHDECVNDTSPRDFAIKWLDNAIMFYN